MNWDQIQGQWQQVRGQAKSTWAKLTDDDIENVAGKRDILIGKIQVRYGVMKEEAEKQVDGWIEKFAEKGNEPKSSATKEGQAS